MAAKTKELIEQVEELEAKALKFVTDAEAPVVDYVGKTAEALVARLPEDRPEALQQGLDAFVGQVTFAKKVLDTQNRFAKKVLDAMVAPMKPARPKTVKAA